MTLIHRRSSPVSITINYRLVGGLEHFLFSHILGIIIPIDFHIFQRGSNHQPAINYRCSWAIYTTGCVLQLPRGNRNGGAGLQDLFKWHEGSLPCLCLSESSAAWKMNHGGGTTKDHLEVS